MSPIATARANEAGTGLTRRMARHTKGSYTLLLSGTILLASFDAPAASGQSAYDRIWSYAHLYQSDTGLVREFSLSGRLQADAIFFDTQEGDFSETEWRRFRFGFKSHLARDWLVHVEGDFDLNAEPGTGYSRLTDAYVGWEPSPDRALKVLKHSAGFTLDGATSSKKLLMLERNNLTNNLWFTEEYFTGASVKGSGEQWDYWVGVFSNDGNDELSKFDASYFTLTSLGYNWAERLGLDNATVRLDYIYNQRDENANTADFSNVVSLTSKWEKGPWGLWTDLSAGRGYFDQSDLWGLSLMPFFSLSERIQLVGRYTYIESEEANGIRFERYQKQVIEGLGDEYHDASIGLNVFFYGHKMKWQSVIQYTAMADKADDGGDHHGWGVATGLRIYW